MRRHGPDGGAEEEGRQRRAAEGECPTPRGSVRRHGADGGAEEEGPQ